MKCATTDVTMCLCGINSHGSLPKDWEPRKDPWKAITIIALFGLEWTMICPGRAVEINLHQFFGDKNIVFDRKKKYLYVLVNFYSNQVVCFITSFFVLKTRCLYIALSDKVDMMAVLIVYVSKQIHEQ